MSGSGMTSEQQFNEFRNLVASLGYDETHLAENYLFVGKGGRQEIVELAGFAKQPLDMSNAVLVGETNLRRGGSLDLAFAAATSLACPAVLWADESEVAFYSLKDQKLIDRITHGQRPSDAIYQSLQRDKLLQSKLRYPEPSLFPVDVNLLTDARRTATSVLKDRVVDARDALYQAAHVRDFRLDATSLAAILVDALTCLFIEDKFQVAFESPEWNIEVSTRFHHLHANLNSYDATRRALLMFAREFLREGINYRSLDSVVIADLYEPRLVDPGADNENGIVYTPFDLAAQIMNRVPVELLEPDERSILDFACGSGTLLLAAHDRLRTAHPQQMNPSHMHDYLVRSLEGWDRDPFAVQLTHLSLTLRGHPLGNGWNIQEKDTLHETPSEKSIVIANPPWGGRRTGRRSAADRSRDDAVTPFVSWAMSSTQAGGLLAMFLPASWLTARHSEQARERLNHDFDLLEVWRLPEDTFRGADVKGSVFIAQKKRRSKAHRLNRYLTHLIPDAISLQAFMTDGAAPETSIVRRPVGRERIGVASTLNPYILSEALVPITEFFDIRSGPPRGRGPATGGVTYRWLGNVRRMDHYGPVTAANTALAIYPRDFDSRAGWDPQVHYDRKKLLISRVRRSDNPWRIKVGLAYEPVIPSNNQYALSVRGATAHEESTLLAAAAVLGSAPVAAWVDDLTTTGNIPKTLVTSIGMPMDWLTLAELAAEAQQLRSQNPRPIPALVEILKQIDEAVVSLYGIPESVWREVARRFEGQPAPEGVIRYERSLDVPSVEVQDRLVWRDGLVLGTDEDEIRIWVDGYTPDDGVTMRAPSRLPASALLPGVTFLASAVDGLERGYFRLHKSNFQEPEEFFPAEDPTGRIGRRP